MPWSTWAVAGRGAVVATAVGAGWLAAASTPWSQSGQAAAQPPVATDLPAGEAETGERAEMKERLSRRVAELDSRSQMLKSAMQRLDRGETLDSVREFVRDRGSIVGKLLADSEAAREIDWLEGRPPPDGMGRGRMGGGREGGRGPEGGMAWRDRAEHGGPLTDEEREVIRDMLRATEPGALPVLDALRAEQEGEADKRMRRLLPVAGVMIELRRRDPALYRLRLEQMRWEREVLSLVKQVVDLEVDAAANSARLEALHKNLREAGGRAFDMRIAVQAHELGKMQERLDTLRQAIAEQESKREELITHHVGRILDGMRQHRADNLNGGPRHDMERPAGHMRPPPPMDDRGERPRRRPARGGDDGPR